MREKVLHRWLVGHALVRARRGAVVRQVVEVRVLMSHRLAVALYAHALFQVKDERFDAHESIRELPQPFNHILLVVFVG